MIPLKFGDLSISVELIIILSTSFWVENYPQIGVALVTRPTF